MAYRPPEPPKAQAAPAQPSNGIRTPVFAVGVARDAEGLAFAFRVLVDSTTRLATRGPGDLPLVAKERARSWVEEAMANGIDRVEAKR